MQIKVNTERKGQTESEIEQNASEEGAKIKEVKEGPPQIVQLDFRVTLKDNIMVMLVKEIQYVEAMTGYKYGFIFTDKKYDYEQSISQYIVSPEHWEIWIQIERGNSKRCQNLRTFLHKMLASKSREFLKQFFMVYMDAIINLLHIEKKFKQYELNQRQLIQFSRLFSKNFCKRIITETAYKEFVSIDPKFVSMALLNRQIQVKELIQFQQDFLTNYSKWRIEFAHFIEVIYFCISLQFHNVSVNYLYQGYFKNTQFQTQRNMPKIKLRT